MNDKEKIKELERKLKRTQELLDSSLAMVTKVQSENLDLLERVRNALLGINVQDAHSRSWGRDFYLLIQCITFCTEKEHAWRIIRQFIASSNENELHDTPEHRQTVFKMVEKIKRELCV